MLTVTAFTFYTDEADINEYLSIDFQEVITMQGAKKYRNWQVISGEHCI